MTEAKAGRSMRWRACRHRPRYVCEMRRWLVVVFLVAGCGRVYPSRVRMRYRTESRTIKRGSLGLWLHRSPLEVIGDRRRECAKTITPSYPPPSPPPPTRHDESSRARTSPRASISRSPASPRTRRGARRRWRWRYQRDDEPRWPCSHEPDRKRSRGTQWSPVVPHKITPHSSSRAQHGLRSASRVQAHPLTNRPSPHTHPAPESVAPAVRSVKISNQPLRPPIYTGLAATSATRVHSGQFPSRPSVAHPPAASRRSPQSRPLGLQVSAVANGHEPSEAITDPRGTAWYDARVTDGACALVCRTALRSFRMARNGSCKACGRTRRSRPARVTRTSAAKKAACRIDQRLNLVGDDELTDLCRTRDLTHAAGLEVTERLNELVLGVHHERTVASDRLAMRDTGEQQDPARWGSSKAYEVAIAEDRELTVA